jgi:hypothetical protein
MVKYPASILIPIITIITCKCLNARENSDPIIKPRRNNILNEDGAEELMNVEVDVNFTK